MFTYIKKSRGIGLIEVLITTLVISFGLLAIASLQGHLVSDSRSNKVASEARALCTAELEELRDNVRQGLANGTTPESYYAIVQGVNQIAGFPKTITGQNETFTVGLCVENLPNTATTKLCPVGSATFTGTGTDPDTLGSGRKRVVSSCTWGAAGTNERIDIESVISYESIRNMINNAGDGSTSASLSAPNTNAGSSDELQSRFKMPTGTVGGSTIAWGTDSTLGQHVKVDADGKYGTLFYNCDSSGITSTASTSGPLVLFENKFYTRRVNYQPAGDFREAIELFQQGATPENPTLDDTMCVPKIRFNGGIILALKGKVYSKATRTLETILMAGSESGVQCYPSAFASGATVADYGCYVGGNCVNGPIGTRKVGEEALAAGAGTAVAGDKTIVTECPTRPSDYTPTLANPYYPSGIYDPGNIGPGGWRGKIGLLGTVYGTTGNSYNNVCFKEEIDDTADTTDSARNYYTRRTNGSVLSNEGVNQPYSCHNFLMINGTTQVNRACQTAAATISGLVLASKDIKRDLTGTTANTVVLAANRDSCAATTYTITGSITGTDAARAAVTVAIDGVACAITPTTGNAASRYVTYTCTLLKNPPVTVPVVVTGGTATYYSIDLTASPTTITGPAVTAGRSAVQVSVTAPGTGTVSGISLTSLPSGVTCTGTASPFTCTGATANWSGTISATGSCSGTPSTVTGSVNVLAADTAVTITLATCTAPVTTYTLRTTAGIGGTTNPAPGTYTYNSGTVVTITATPSFGYTFAGWTGDCSGTGACSVTMDADKSVGATFTVATTTYTLRTSTGTGGTVNPAPGNYTYNAGTVVTITAIPNSGYAFAGWTGDCSGTGACSVTMNADKSVGATFTALSTFTVSGSISYSSATAADLLSIASPCSFTGGTAKTGYTCPVTSGSALTISISFTDGTGSNNRAVCFGSVIDTSSPATFSYTSVTANTTLNIAVKKGTSLSCP